MASLFDPFVLKGLTLPNRVVMAPMTRRFCPGGIVGPGVADYYRRRAEGGCGLIITEGVTVNSPVASAYSDAPQFWGEALEGWKPVVKAVHDAGGLIMPQIWHVGLMREPQTMPPNPELAGHGPSGLDRYLNKVAEPMTIADIKQAVEAFGHAALSARKLGFDGVEVHGAHGYLVDQFLWGRTNLRSDIYGGNLARRAQFAIDVGRAIRIEVGDDFPLLIRISQWKSFDYQAKLAETPELLRKLLLLLVDAGYDAFDCSQRRFWEPEFEGSPLNFAGWVKKLSGKPAITVGSVGLASDFIGALRTREDAAISGIEELLGRLERDEFDLVAVGRALISDPQWPNKIKERRSEDLLPFSGADLAELF